MADIIHIAPPRRNLPSVALTPEHVLSDAIEADLTEDLVIGRRKDGSLYVQGAKSGLYQQSRRDVRDLCQEVIDRLMIARMAEETA